MLGVSNICPKCCADERSFPFPNIGTFFIYDSTHVGTDTSFNARTFFTYESTHVETDISPDIYTFFTYDSTYIGSDPSWRQFDTKSGGR